MPVQAPQPAMQDTGSWSEELIRALAVPSGSMDALRELQRRYVAGWRRELSAYAADLAGCNQTLAKRLDVLANAAVTPDEQFRDPRFMAWMERLHRALEEGAADDDLLRRIAAQPSEKAPNALIGHGRVALFHPQDCPELACSISAEERGAPPSVQDVDTEISRALQLLRRVWPEAGLDVDRYFRGILAVQPPPGYFSSGSSARLPYILKLPIHPKGWPAILADAIVHETAHVKLRCVMRFEPLLDPDETPRYRHPWRKEPRPLSALLIATHAFVSIFSFYVRYGQHNPSQRNVTQIAEPLAREVEQALRALLEADGLLETGRRVAGFLQDEFVRSRAILFHGGGFEPP